MPSAGAVPTAHYHAHACIAPGLAASKRSNCGARVPLLRRHVESVAHGSQLTASYAYLRALSYALSRECSDT
jgi:hypothetical protein